MKKKLKRIIQQVLMEMMTQEMRWQAQERSLSRTYEPLIAQAKGDERRKVRQEYSDQLWEIEHERRKDGDFKLIRKAHRYDIPIPRRREEDGFWEEVGTGYWQLTEKGTHHLLKEIRQEQKERLALWKTWLDVWIGWVPLIIGIIGALIGLVSVLGK